MSDSPPTPPGQQLGALLAEARRSKGLELSDVAEVTHVRKEYLRALEDGRYQALPEDVYARNFVKLYAQAVGFDERQALQLFSQERRSTPGVVAAEPEAKPELEVDLVAAPRNEPRRLGALWQGSGLSWLVPSLLVVGALVGVAVWAFNSLLFPASPVSPAQPEVVAPQPLAPPRVESLVLLSVTSEPPGAEVSLDGFVFATPTPIVNAPVTPGRDRLLRVALEGFETFEAPIDVTFDRNLSVALTPLEGAVGAPVADANSITLVVEATSWLEVYSGASRGGGATLLFRNVQPGETFTFPLPVFLHVGNAGGIVASLGGQEIGRLGASGEVLSRAFTAP
ncbi:MAG: helix-turn-helix domain-containing protein [Truepera sp.]|nr:helix-turn-helix domain-containing protein [Truepera sp.]